MSYAHLLRNISLFAQISDDELDALSSDLLLQTFHKNQVLFEQGSITSSLYIVKSGQIQVRVFGRDRGITYTGLYGPEQCFGEFSLLDGLPRSGEAVALVNSDVLVLTRPAFFRFLEQRPAVALKLLVTISRRMRFAEAAVEHPAVMPPEQQIASTLLEIAGHYGSGGDTWTQLALRLTADDLASLSGVTRDRANAALSDLTKRDIIKMERSHVVSIEVGKLRTMLTPPIEATSSA